MFRGRFATRHLLPLEMVVYSMLGSVAWNGAFGSGLLHDLLQKSHETATWLAIVGLTALAGFGVAIGEWVWGVEWTDEGLRRWLSLRKWCAALGVVVCSYAVYTVFDNPGGVRFAGVIGTAIVLSVFLVWSWWANYRAETVLDPELPTSRLENTLVSRRARW